MFSWRVPRSGASYSAIFEWEQAAHWRGYSREAFEKLDGERQSEIIAHFRAASQLEAVIAHQQAQEAKRRKR